MNAGGEGLHVAGLPDSAQPITGEFTTHHPGRPHAVVMWNGAPFLVWRHPDGDWVTEAKVSLAPIAAAVARLTTWQPWPEGGPDVEECLAWRHDAGVMHVVWQHPDDDFGAWFTAGGEDLTGDAPSHWMPLPEGPAEQAPDDSIGSRDPTAWPDGRWP